MQGDIVSSVLLPLILAIIMFTLGLGLTIADFRRILAQPKALIIGFICHFLLLPLVCFLLLKTFGITGIFAVGFMILAACPTGATSNLLTYLARGDVALAVSFTAVASIVTIVTLPFIVSWSLGYFMADVRSISAPIPDLMKQLVVALGLPVSLGMLVRAYASAFAIRIEPLATKIATVLFILIVIAAISKNWPVLRDNFFTLAHFAIGLNVLMMVIGFSIAYLARLSWPQSVTLGIETAVQNATLAMVIASTVLKNDQMAIPGALYGVLMYVGGLLFAYLMRRRIEPNPAG